MEGEFYGLNIDARFCAENAQAREEKLNFQRPALVKRAFDGVALPGQRVAEFVAGGAEYLEPTPVVGSQRSRAPDHVD